MTWLKTTYGIGHGHANAMSHLIRSRPGIGDKHVGMTGAHRGESNMLRLDGSPRKPEVPPANR